MGRHLFIRVSVHTFDEKQVQKTWPTLWAIAWPDEFLPKRPEKKRVEALSSPINRGVIEIVHALSEEINFGNRLDQKSKQILEPLLAKTRLLVQSLEDSLASRDVPMACKLTNQIEDSLDDLERTAKDAGILKR